MKKHSLLAITILILTIFSHGAKNVSAAELVTNGSFETGNFAGWTAINASGSWMDWQVSTTGQGGGYNPPYPTAAQHGTRSAWNGVTANGGSQYVLYQNVTIPAGSTASVSWKSRFQMNLFDFCTTCGTAHFVVDIMNSTGTTVLQTLYNVTAPGLTETDTGWRTHGFNLGTTYAGQTIRLRFRSWATQTFTGPGQAEIDAVSLQAPAVPTSANVSVGGQIKTADGSGIRNVVVSLTGSDGTTRTALTSAFGFYRFDEVPIGSYTISVASKRFTFINPTRVIAVEDNVSDVDWTAIE